MLIGLKKQMTHFNFERVKSIKIKVPYFDFTIIHTIFIL